MGTKKHNAQARFTLGVEGNQKRNPRTDFSYALMLIDSSLLKILETQKMIHGIELNKTINQNHFN